MSLKFNFSNSRVAGRLTESRTRQHKCAQPNFEFRLFRFSDNKSVIKLSPKQLQKFQFFVGVKNKNDCSFVRAYA